MPLAETGPAFADDVLVEPFAGAEPENETVVAEHRHCRRGLRHDRRMVAHDRAGDGRHQPDMARGLNSGSEHRPGKRRMALLVEPRERNGPKSPRIRTRPARPAPCCAPGRPAHVPRPSACSRSRSCFASFRCTVSLSLSGVNGSRRPGSSSARKAGPQSGLQIRHTCPFAAIFALDRTAQPGKKPRHEDPGFFRPPERRARGEESPVGTHQSDRREPGSGRAPEGAAGNCRGPQRPARRAQSHRGRSKATRGGRARRERSGRGRHSRGTAPGRGRGARQEDSPRRTLGGPPRRPSARKFWPPAEPGEKPASGKASGSADRLGRTPGTR